MISKKKVSIVQWLQTGWVGNLCIFSIVHKSEAKGRISESLFQKFFKEHLVAFSLEKRLK